MKKGRLRDKEVSSFLGLSEYIKRCELKSLLDYCVSDIHKDKNKVFVRSHFRRYPKKRFIPESVN